MHHCLTNRIAMAGTITLALGLSPSESTASASTTISVDASRGAHGLDADASGSLVAPDADRDEPAAAVVGAAAAEIDLASGDRQSPTPVSSRCDSNVIVAVGRASTTCLRAGGDGDTPIPHASLATLAMEGIDRTVGVMHARIASPLGPDAGSGRADRPVGRSGGEIGPWSIDDRSDAILGFVGSIAALSTLIFGGIAGAHLRPSRFGATRGAAAA